MIFLWCLIAVLFVAITMKATPAALTGLEEEAWDTLKRKRTESCGGKQWTVHQNGAASEEGYSMRFKARKPLRKLRLPVTLVEPGDILLCYELAKNLPACRLTDVEF